MIEVLEGITLPQPAEPADGTTAEAAVLQDFRPITESLEWELSQLYWQSRGVRPFVENDVPYTINNSGQAAQNAAAVFLAQCKESRQQQQLSSGLGVIELGAGLGMFAKQFLNAFRQLCIEQGCDFYDRLVYYVTDGSEATVQQWRDRGMFDSHTGHVVTARCDATTPGKLIGADGGDTTQGAWQAVFANYLLDSLPMAVVRRQGDEEQQLCVRTLLPAHAHDAVRRAGLTTDEVIALARSVDTQDRKRLLPLTGVFDVELKFLADDAAALPHIDELLAYSPDVSRTLLNHGAIACLEACIGLLDPDGFILINDYGPTRTDQIEGLTLVQRFGGSVAAGLNFPFLEHHLTGLGHKMHKAPGDDERMIHARLICKCDLPETTREFATRYGDEHYIQADNVANTAIGHIQAGNHHEALECYKTAIRHCPTDWHLLAQAAEFLTQQLQKYDEALVLAQAAVEINRWHSAYLWNTLGNCHYCLGQYDEAHEAYLRAQSIHADDPQTCLNLAFTLANRNEHGRALGLVARGLEHDTDGRFRQHLLDQQQRIITAIAGQATAHQQRLTARQNAFGTAK